VFFFQAEDGIRDRNVTGVQTCALPICRCRCRASRSTCDALPEPSPMGWAEEGWAFGPFLSRGCAWPSAGTSPLATVGRPSGARRSEERRVGKEWRDGGGAWVEEEWSGV